ncbi:Hypothetical protein PHPALM_13826 [Phytophthora palmivora]|uniref:Uncharacterized protein n=1 Tax=Phytophthora palmivora TaxID=4796 RepID=A0A2P4XWC4_9STRA|nr:Hypothetical protein PHPALM_13826 [Phytophthora palmivora]
MLATTPGETGSLVHYQARMAPVSVETLQRIMEAVTRTVERAIAVDIPEKFGIIFDGWSHDSEHYIAVFAHQDILATMLARNYQKRPEQVLILVGNKCGVNRRLATLTGVPLVGCVSHRLNRAVAAQLSECADDLDLVQAQMIKLWTLHHSAKLRFKTDLRPIIRQQTHWSSTFSMLNRYFELLPFIDAADEELAEMLPPAASKRRLRDLLGELKDVESVSKTLQGADANLLDARISHCGEALIYPLSRADIVHSPDFEAGCVRVLKRQAKRLTRAEKAALDPLLVTP